MAVPETSRETTRVNAMHKIKQMQSTINLLT